MCKDEIYYWFSDYSNPPLLPSDYSNPPFLPTDFSNPPCYPVTTVIPLCYPVTTALTFCYPVTTVILLCYPVPTVIILFYPVTAVNNPLVSGNIDWNGTLLRVLVTLMVENVTGLRIESHSLVTFSLMKSIYWWVLSLVSCLVSFNFSYLRCPRCKMVLSLAKFQTDCMLKNSHTWVNWFYSVGWKGRVWCLSELLPLRNFYVRWLYRCKMLLSLAKLSTDYMPRNYHYLWYGGCGMGTLPLLVSRDQHSDS